MEHRKLLAPHPLPPDSDKFLAWCSPAERAVHLLAIQQLASSYFMEKSHGYKAWKNSKDYQETCKKEVITTEATRIEWVEEMGPAVAFRAKSARRDPI
jgi:hypothetical protein